MNKFKVMKYIFLSNLVLIILLLSFYFISGNDLYYVNKEKSNLMVQSMLDIDKGDVVEQSLDIDFNTIEYIEILGNVKEKEDAFLNIKIKDSKETIVFDSNIDITKLKENVLCNIILNKPIINEGKLTLILTGNNINLYTNNYYDNGKVQVSLNKFNEALRYNDLISESILCYKIIGKNYHYWMEYYKYLAVIIEFIYLILSIYIYVCYRNKKDILVINFCKDLYKYKFLIEQMVKRDFKNKYKRSILGIFWSLLNPLFMLVVQYAIFSMLFKSVIDKFPIYLLIGIICFNFASEAIGRCLMSIVDNSYLLFKVYIPKYIFPLSYVMSSSINLLLSFILLFIFIVLNDISINEKFLLLPYGVFCLLFFCLGLGLILATLMVYFRDIQFFWGIINTLWLYLTPIFYPETIIPSEYIDIYRLNPLYPIITFFRSIIINGISPEPVIYLQCFITSGLFFIIGVYLFRWREKDFIYYI